MKVNFNAPVLDLDDAPIVHKNGLSEVFQAMLLAGIKHSAAENVAAGLVPFMDDKEAKREEMTYAKLISNCLGNAEKDADWAERVDRIDLATRIRKAAVPLEIDMKDKERIVKCVKLTTDLPLYAYRVEKLLAAAAAEPVAEAS